MSEELAPEEAEECADSAGEFLVRRRRLFLEEDPVPLLLPLILFADPAPPPAVPTP